MNHRGYYALLFATLVFEKNHRFLDRVIQNAKPQYDLKYTPNEPNAEILIFGYPHTKLTSIINMENWK